MQTAPRIDTRFLSAGKAAAVVGRKGLAQCLAGLAGYIESDFKRWPSFEKTARLASHSAAGVIELMPISDGTLYAFKYVNGHPGNLGLGLSTVMAFGVLADVRTGVPTLISDLTLATALRTAATSALAARTLARPDSRVMAIIGNGAQSEFQALAFHHLLGIQEFHLFDTDPAATAKLMANLFRLGLSATRFATSKAAVRGTDIVTTITADKRRACILTPDMIEPGMHINGVGGDCPGKTELHPDVLRMGRVFVEYTPQTRVEGDIQQMPADFPVTELWQVLTGGAGGRGSPADITIFDSVGFALEDFAALRFMGDTAMELGMLGHISLVPELTDPKDLFSCIPALAKPVPTQLPGASLARA